jgi:transcriptional regulator with XRE-family HTH domain
MTLGKKLKQCRNLKGLTLRDVQEECEISNSYLNQIENDNVKEPSPRVLWSLSEFYNVSYEELMQLAGYIPAKTSGNDRLFSGVALNALKELTEEEKQAVEAIILHYRKLHREQKKAQG